ncbi:MAG: N4-gp56 family major capsid protein [Candidatus Sericytochromatia bacterium]|uniref:N4-gp56 family major capsid protein n=1 Tax=Candidatus Tanganyikabacteria bacterium TaxID=2961651 RepID=A0A937X3R5_9BACT|nr:N4-gp56 family major capsid protein [Candidatus Tanganyikabacteria bacterium]
MANTQVATNSSLNILRTQEKLIGYMAERENPFANFIGSGMENAIQRLTDLEKKRGDTVKVHLGTKLTGAGITGDNTLEGNEEALSWYNDSVIIDQLRHAVRLDGQMTEQRSAISLRADAGERLGIWSREVLTEMLVFYLSGARGVRTGHILPANWTGHAGNALQAPDANHILYAGAAGTKAGMAGSDKMTPALLDTAVKKIKLLINTSAAMRPIKSKGKNYYLCLMPAEHVFDLRQNATWQNAQQYANVRGDDNPIFSGADGLWNGLIIHEMPEGVLFNDYGGAGNVVAARTMIMGAQALGIAYGNAGGTDAAEGRWKYIEKDNFDYFNQCGFAMATIMGIKKLRFNNADYGCFAVDASYS